MARPKGGRGRVPPIDESDADRLDDVRAYLDALSRLDERLLAFGERYGEAWDSIHARYGADLLGWQPDEIYSSRRLRSESGTRRATIAYAEDLAERIHALTDSQRAAFVEQLATAAIKHVRDCAIHGPWPEPGEGDVNDEAWVDVNTAWDAAWKRGTRWEDELRAVIRWTLDRSLFNALRDAEHRRRVRHILVRAIRPGWIPDKAWPARRIGTLLAVGEQSFLHAATALHNLFALVKPADVLAWYDGNGTIPEEARHELENVARAVEDLTVDPDLHRTRAGVLAGRANLVDAIRRPAPLGKTAAHEGGSGMVDRVLGAVLHTSALAQRDRRLESGLRFDREKPRVLSLTAGGPEQTDSRPAREADPHDRSLRPPDPRSRSRRRRDP